MQETVCSFSCGNLRICRNGETVTAICRTDELPTAQDPFFEIICREITEYLAGKRKQFSFSFSPEGTDFQKAVWQELLSIPYGETRTYGEIAEAIGSPGASRAVGAACRLNPILFAVPCHRVIGAKGALTGYAAGVELKKALLQMESSQK